jgi:outer membrane protein assembly factor BamE (lipoprotein component of BamABCDE complex)
VTGLSLLRRAALLTLLFALPGCAVGYQTQGRIIDARDVAQLSVGESSKQDVLDLFGPPTQLSRAVGIDEAGLFQSDEPTWIYDTKEDVYRYEYVEHTEHFFSLLVYTYWDRTSLADTLMVIFDDKEVVKHVAFSKETDAEPEDAEE